jgi:site-specific DNA recombinase
MVQWMLEKGTIQQIKTFERDYNPSDNVVMASIEFSMANQYVRDLSKNVKRGQAEKIRRGEYPATPPLGYLLDYKTKKIHLDEDKWHYVKRAFQLYATGNYSTPNLAEQLSKEGLRSRTGRRVHGSSIHKMLNNPIYYGWFRWKEQIYKGIHTPIVSKDLYDAVQEVFHPRKHTVERNIHTFVFRGHLVCGECGLKITAETQKGHSYYHCTKSRGTSKCSQKYLREEDLIQEIEKCLAKLKVDEPLLDLMIEASKTVGQREWDGIRETEKKHQALLANNKFRQDSLIEKFIDNAIPEEHYNRKLAELRNEEATIEDDLRSVKENFHNVFEKIEQAATFAKHAKKIFERGNLEIKKEVVAILSSNILIKDKKILEFRLAEPFDSVIKDIENSKHQKKGKPGFELAKFVSSKTKTASSREAVPSMHGRQDSNLK